MKLKLRGVCVCVCVCARTGFSFTLPSLPANVPIRSTLQKQMVWNCSPKKGPSPLHCPSLRNTPGKVGAAHFFILFSGRSRRKTRQQGQKSPLESLRDEREGSLQVFTATSSGIVSMQGACISLCHQGPGTQTFLYFLFNQSKVRHTAKKSTNNECWRGCGKKGTPTALLVGMEFTQTHVHRVGDAIHPSHPLSSPSPPALNLSQHRGLFQ